ncbi:RNA polymerase sigma factor SigJ [Cohnella hongkongensis]|uniref:RNA polymerase sigma factor SigJ n=1 Tax=Cohnella hongkongensis TaxID=178337 RepID=A0ABV9F8Y6_9BACL
MTIALAYEQHRPMLFGLAYRMLGIVADAEDVVQDVFAQYMQTDAGEIANEKAYLAKMTANRCINLLKSSRRRRETYVGEWLPEPLPAGERDIDPAERRESIGYAYLVLLQRLTPLERAVYVLKEALGFEYADVSRMLERTETSCRKTLSRAKAKIGDAAAAQPAGGREDAKERFIDTFLRASDTGNFRPLLALLLDDVVLVSDGGGKARAAIRPIFGIKRVLAFFEGLAAKGSFREGFERMDLNGEPGLALRNEEGVVTKVMCAEWEPGGSRIRRLYIVVNPDKLTRVI